MYASAATRRKTSRQNNCVHTQSAFRQSLMASVDESQVVDKTPVWFCRSIWLVPSKIQMVRVTWSRPFRGWFVMRWLALAINLSTKFEVSNSINYTKIRKTIHNIKNGVVWGSQESLKVTGNNTIWQSAYEFLLAFRSNYVPILHRFWDIARYWYKIADCSLPHLYLSPPLGWHRWNFAEIFGNRKLESLCYLTALFAWSYTQPFGTIPACDRRTDGRMDGHKTTASTAQA